MQMLVWMVINWNENNSFWTNYTAVLHSSRFKILLKPFRARVAPIQVSKRPTDQIVTLDGRLNRQKENWQPISSRSNRESIDLSVSQLLSHQNQSVGQSVMQSRLTKIASKLRRKVHQSCNQTCNFICVLFGHFWWQSKVFKLNWRIRAITCYCLCG